MDPNTLAQNFLNEYYGAQSNNRANLINFYNENSCLSYNGDHFKGLQKIKEKIEGLGFSKIVYKFDKDFTVQPGLAQNSYLIVVTGALQMDGEGEGFKFTHTFQLAPNGSGGFYLHNDIMKLLI